MFAEVFRPWEIYFNPVLSGLLHRTTLKKVVCHRMLFSLNHGGLDTEKLIIWLDGRKFQPPRKVASILYIIHYNGLISTAADKTRVNPQSSNPVAERPPGLKAFWPSTNVSTLQFFLSFTELLLCSCH